MKIKKRIKIPVFFDVIFMGMLFFPAMDRNVTVYENDKSIKDLEIQVEKQKQYELCVQEDYVYETEEMIALKEELSLYLSQYNCSVSYYDTLFGFNYSYNKDKVYYAASTIKMLDAIYIYEKASLGELDLDYKMTYSSKFRLGSSKMMKNYEYGDKVSLRELVKYAVTVSDNTAHKMLVKYIGFNNLKEFGKSLGAKYTLYGDIFGSITVDDSIIYLKELKSFIDNNPELGNELKDYFINSEQNYLNIIDLDIEAAEKYGEYGNIYHENGIVYADNPYLVSILTLEGVNEKIIRDINEHVYKLHTDLYAAKENYCYNKFLK